MSTLTPLETRTHTLIQRTSVEMHTVDWDALAKAKDTLTS